MKISELRKKSIWVRRQVLEMAVSAGAGHIAPSFSCIDILVALYYGGILRVDSIFTEVYILTHCRLVTNNFEFPLTEFRYQYTPNTFTILLFIFLVARFTKTSPKRNKLILIILILPLILNVLCIRRIIAIYNCHYAD